MIQPQIQNSQKSPIDLLEARQGPGQSLKVVLQNTNPFEIIQEKTEGTNDSILGQEQVKHTDSQIKRTEFTLRPNTTDNS